MYLIVWATGNLDNLTDHWETAESKKAAMQKYNELCEDENVYTASVATPIASTDYM